MNQMNPAQALREFITQEGSLLAVKVVAPFKVKNNSFVVS